MRAGAPLVYTGRECQRFVSHVLTGYGLADGWCCLSFRLPHAAGESVPVASAEVMDALNWVDDFIARCRSHHALTISGLMCIPPADDPPAPHFALTAMIARRNGLSQLSMGMSADFAEAIALGATHVRVGSAIFGTRG